MARQYVELDRNEAQEALAMYAREKGLLAIREGDTVRGEIRQDGQGFVAFYVTLEPAAPKDREPT